ncbi:MAG: hypothetical protein R3B90_19225 [Planctomycetaceae bacterium]
MVCVRKLKKKSYECGERCVLSWEAKAVCTRCCKPGQLLRSAGTCAPAGTALRDRRCRPGLMPAVEPHPIADPETGINIPAPPSE